MNVGHCCQRHHQEQHQQQQQYQAQERQLPAVQIKKMKKKMWVSWQTLAMANQAPAKTTLLQIENNTKQ